MNLSTNQNWELWSEVDAAYNNCRLLHNTVLSIHQSWFLSLPGASLDDKRFFLTTTKAVIHSPGATGIMLLPTNAGLEDGTSINWSGSHFPPMWHSKLHTSYISTKRHHIPKFAGRLVECTVLYCTGGMPRKPIRLFLWARDRWFALN